MRPSQTRPDENAPLTGRWRARPPVGTRVYAIGDVHGRLDLLDKLLERIVRDAGQYKDTRRRVLVYLGDYIDRGRDSRGVVERLLSGPPPGFEAVHLLGNHEDYLIQSLDHPEQAVGWLRWGGDATLRSYGLEPLDLSGGPGGLERLRTALRRLIPREHLDFLQSLRLWHREGDYLFVHAGIRPGTPLEGQSRDDLIWIREPFLNDRRDHGQVVVHGHTPVPAPEIHHNRIGVDTGACYGGRLTAAVLHDEDVAFLQVS